MCYRPSYPLMGATELEYPTLQPTFHAGCTQILVDAAGQRNPISRVKCALQRIVWDVCSRGLGGSLSANLRSQLTRRLPAVALAKAGLRLSSQRATVGKPAFAHACLRLKRELRLGRPCEGCRAEAEGRRRTKLRHHLEGFEAVIVAVATLFVRSVPSKPTVAVFVTSLPGGTSRFNVATMTTVAVVRGW